MPVTKPLRPAERATAALVNRRSALAAGAASFAALAQPNRLLASDNSNAKPTGKSVILLWMAGGPSQIDTWDPKGKGDPAKNATGFQTKPWTIEVTGQAENTGTFNLEDFIAPHTLEERIYRLRCVEAWSMVIPWNGISLGLIDIAKRHTTRKKHADVGMRVCDYPTIQDYVGEAVIDTNASRAFTFQMGRTMDDLTSNCLVDVLGLATLRLQQLT